MARLHLQIWGAALAQQTDRFEDAALAPDFGQTLERWQTRVLSRPQTRSTSKGDQIRSPVTIGEGFLLALTIHHLYQAVLITEILYGEGSEAMPDLLARAKDQYSVIARLVDVSDLKPSHPRRAVVQQGIDGTTFRDTVSHFDEYVLSTGGRQGLLGAGQLDPYVICEESARTWLVLGSENGERALMLGTVDIHDWLIGSVKPLLEEAQSLPVSPQIMDGTTVPDGGNDPVAPWARLDGPPQNNLDTAELRAWVSAWGAVAAWHQMSIGHVLQFPPHSAALQHIRLASATFPFLSIAHQVLQSLELVDKCTGDHRPSVRAAVENATHSYNQLGRAGPAPKPGRPFAPDPRWTPVPAKAARDILGHFSHYAVGKGRFQATVGDGELEMSTMRGTDHQPWAVLTSASRQRSLNFPIRGLMDWIVEHTRAVIDALEETNT